MSISVMLKTLQLRFINEVKTRLTVKELLELSEEQINFLEKIDYYDYGFFLQILETKTFEESIQTYKDYNKKQNNENTDKQ